MKSDGSQRGLCAHIIEEVQANPSLYKDADEPGTFRNFKFDVHGVKYMVVQHFIQMGEGLDPVYIEACYQELEETGDPQLDDLGCWSLLDESELAMLYAGLNSKRQLKKGKAGEEEAPH